MLDSEFHSDSTDSGSEASDIEELQEAFAKGLLKPGLNTVEHVSKQHVNNAVGLKQVLEEFKWSLPWVETLDCVNKEAPLAPELAAKMQSEEQKRENQLKNNKKLPQFNPRDDPVLNDFKREMSFHRQAQATVTEAMPKLKKLGLSTIRPDDYFAEMAKSDEQMQKIRTNLMKKQAQQQRSEKVKQLRLQRKAGKTLQTQAKLQKAQDKKKILEEVKKVRKGVSKNLDFLDKDKKGTWKSKKAMEKRISKDKKFGFGGKKRGMKSNTKESSANVLEYRNSKKKNIKAKNNKRPGKNHRQKNKRKK